jgi:hypothetical protein
LLFKACRSGFTLTLDGAADEANDVGILAQPAVSSHLEQIRSLSWIGHQDAPKKISGMRRDIFWESQRCADNVFVQQVDVVAFWVGWIVVEWQVSCQHGIL